MRALFLSVVTGLSFALVSACAPPPARAVSAADCAEVPSDEEVGVLFSRPVRKVEPIHRYRAALDHHELEGAAIKLAPTTASREHLELAFTCHASRHEVTALRQAPSAVDPLRPPSGKATVRVEEVGPDLVVKVTATDDKVAREILERAQALARKASGG